MDFRSERALEEALAKIAKLEATNPGSSASPVAILRDEDPNYRTPNAEKAATRNNLSSPTPKTASPKLSLRQLRALHARSPFNVDRL